MRRAASMRLGATLALFLASSVPIARSQAIPSASEEAAKRLGFYFALSLEGARQLGPANAIGSVFKVPPPGQLPEPSQDVNGEFKERLSLGFSLGFRLRQDHGRVELRYYQWDEKKDLRTEAPEGSRILNSLASPAAGFVEDIGQHSFAGPPDGLVDGYEAGTLSEGSESADRPRDGAEDWNRDALGPDFIRFGTSDEIVGALSTDYKLADIDYVRKLKRVRRFELDGRIGVRVASVEQDSDVGYRENDSFAVYTDDEGCNGCTREATAPLSPIWDGDGDGETQATQNEADGDGFFDGDSDGTISDRLESVTTVTEDRIVCAIDTSGVGLKLGVDGRYDLSKKWTLSGGLGLSVLKTDVEYRYRETFTSERDRYLNYIEWDFNGDGRYDNFDLDFDGSCMRGSDAPCRPTQADQDVVTATGYVPIDTRLGIDHSIVSARLGLSEPRGVNQGAFVDGPFGNNFGHLRVGDPVPESERNRDVLRETTLLRDFSGTASSYAPVLDLHVGVDYQFSKFASVSLGLRSTRWFDSGDFRSIASDVVASRSIDADGDFDLHGYYVMLTVVPR